MSVDLEAVERMAEMMLEQARVLAMQAEGLLKLLGVEPDAEPTAKKVQFYNMEPHHGEGQRAGRRGRKFG